MKKTFQALTLVAFLIATSMSFMSFTASEGDDGGRIKVYIVNKCSDDVDYRVESPGSATSYTAYDGTKSPKTFMEGTKIYNSDGKLVHTVTSSSEGDEVIVCD
ncbi:MAG: hypothetical protein QNK23_10660 [Crocinitomicaceae bacterium]|nr:hypothetical protein [Crocinitomicaceae bacterium]